MTDEEHAGFGFTHDQARAMRAELERELEDRRRYFPGMIRKASMTEQDADRRLALWRDLIADLARAFNPDVMQRRELPLSDRRFSWREKIAEIRRELALRDAVYPDRIAKARMTEAEAKRRCDTLQLVHDLYWRKCLCWEPEGELARKHHAECVRRFEAGDRSGWPTPPPGQDEMREELRAHMLATLAEPTKQAELAI